MARLVWDELVARRYEAGVSHGVLYLPEAQGIVWNGLISVSDRANGAEHQPLYQDGIKYYDFVGGKDYQANVTAYSAPKEFSVCDGEQSIIPGVRVTKQPRSEFNFSYQTHYPDGYKIHLIYNVLATLDSKIHATEGDLPNPTIFSWTFNAVPVSALGFKPSAHYVVDSNDSDLVILTELEAILYGTGINDAEFPTVEDLVALFEVVIP